MRSLPILLGLFAAGASALSRRQALPTDNSTVTIAPGRFMVEVAKGESLSAASQRIEATGVKIVKQFDSKIFTGFSVESDEDNVDSLQGLAPVSNAWPVARIQLNFTRPTGFSDDATAANYSVHKYTGVQELHDAGVYGKGAVVAVIDTGIQYTHPALGGGFGPGFKVAGGYDFIGDGEWPLEDKTPDADPNDQLGHGTHVAGIVAGKSEWFTGVAPEATLLAYKVFGVYDYTDEDVLVEAFLKAYEDGADVITSSIGGLSGFSDGPWATVASRLVDEGVVVTISAGNNGMHGPFFGSNGSMGKNVLAIASTDPEAIPANPFQATFSLDGASNTTQLGYFPARLLWDVEDLPIYPLSLDTDASAEACQPLPTDTPNLSGYVVLARWGGCTFEEKQINIDAFGARYILFYNTEQPIASPSITGSQQSVLAMIEAAAGEAIIGTIKAGGNVTASFDSSDTSAVGVWNSAGGIPSQFTSWGGGFEMEVKPDVAAPGANILSTYPENQWAVLSGTSMSCPYVAGVAALYISQHGGRKVHGAGTGKKIADQIRASGAAVPWQYLKPEALPIEHGYWAPVPQVGTGQVNAAKVVNYKTTLSFAPFALNDTSHFSRYHKVDITNGADTPVTYTFMLQPAGTFDAQSTWYDGYLSYVFEDPMNNPYTLVPKVSFPSGTFTVQPGQTRTAQFNFAPITGANEAKYPVYSGKVLISGSNGEELSVPYFGGAFRLKEQIRSSGAFPSTLPWHYGGAGRDEIESYHTYDFNLTWYRQGFPKVVTELKWGTRQLRWDFYEPGWKERSWKYPPVVGENGYIGSATYWIDSGSAWAYDPSYGTKEETLPFPVTNLPRTSWLARNRNVFWWFGKLANGTYIAPGNYTMRFAALIPFSEPEHSNNWDVWQTPEITILPYTP